MLNIVIPMAGAGSRFANAGYKNPKPLIEINGMPMIKLVINNLRPMQQHRFIFVCQQEHIKEFDLVDKLLTWAPCSKVIGINGLTEGAACTVLAAREFIGVEDPLMIANSDQYVDLDIDEYLKYMAGNKFDGLIMTMKANDPKWSYVGFSEQGDVNRVVEKKVISDEATVGIYNFARGGDFIKAADEMIAKNIRTNNEFYVAPAYNLLIEQNKRIGVFNIGQEGMGMYGLGVPADLEYFITTSVCDSLKKS